MSLPTLESTTRELNNIWHALDQSAIVAITDRAGTITHVNSRFCKISQFSREELIGQNHRILNSGYHPPEFFQDMWKTILSGRIWEGEIRNRAKNGSYYWVNTTIVPFLDERDEPYQYVSIRYEITERKRAEEQLRIYADRLELSNRELQDFASIAAHDLQEPLRKVQAFGDRLKTRYGSTLEGEGRDYVERMLSSVGRMRKLIDDLLTYSRVSLKARPFETVDLNSIVREVWVDLEVRVEQVAGKIDYRDLPTIDADPTQMRQLFQNLFSNALKFHRDRTPPIITVTGQLQGSRCKITIEDNGIGFEEKYVDKIFTIFQRLHGRHEYEGTGVGLAVCRRIAERHSGTITARSKLGVGSCFEIEIPIRQKPNEVVDAQ